MIALQSIVGEKGMQQYPLRNSQETILLRQENGI